jgi:hypothetical protein
MAARSSSRLARQAHKAESCDCYDSGVVVAQKRCNYREFPDGWSFVADAGNAQARGEIFTPRWVVDQMIVDAGILPDEAVHLSDYSRPQPAYIERRVCEPAVGTGNYLATILYHRLRYAAALAGGAGGGSPDLDRYHTHLLKSVASVYAYDIDVGNLEVAKRRLLSSGKHPLNDAQTIDQWTLSLTKWLNQDSERKKVSYEAVKPSVLSSLNEAHRHWNRFVKDGQGIIDSAYRQSTGGKMPNWLYDQCQEILSKNLLLFNGIKETDTLDWQTGFFVPGYGAAEWTWWHFDYPHERGWQPGMNEKTVLFRDMLPAAS